MGRVKIVTLLLTHRCSLRCSYCYVRDYSGGSMELETAKRIVRESFRECEGRYDLLEFAYLGGEPFEAFPTLRELSEWIWANDWPLPYRLTAVTNGTLITGGIRSWLEENRGRITPAFSFDGMRSQEQTRAGSLARIDLEWYHDIWPDAAVKMTIAEANAGSLFADITDLWGRGIPVNDTFAGGVRPWRAESLEELDRQLAMLTEFLLKEKPRACSQLLSVDLTGVLYDKVSRPFPCGAGESRVTYDCDGRKYSCHLLSPLVLTAEEQEAYGKAENRAFSESGRCKTCPLDAICPRCDANSFRFFGRFGEREDAMCELFRHQVLHACRYQTKAILARAGAARGETERAGTGEAGAAERDRLTIVAVNKIMRRGSDVFAGQNPGAFR